MSSLRGEYTQSSFPTTSPSLSPDQRGIPSCNTDVHHHREFESRVIPPAERNVRTRVDRRAR